ncbi:hypothetical protein RN001_001200 [Aquatica leii]|uniref:ZP domain-containing protein n=1 Tax=Aquatica leii TaxID=1421715 RepID=A0AAN7Q3R9_9COLE|nr:hypothetical protein RN001_001200 [Aquatica leii]
MSASSDVRNGNDLLAELENTVQDLMNFVPAVEWDSMLSNNDPVAYMTSTSEIGNNVNANDPKCSDVRLYTENSLALSNSQYVGKSSNARLYAQSTFALNKSQTKWISVGLRAELQFNPVVELIGKRQCITLIEIEWNTLVCYRKYCRMKFSISFLIVLLAIYCLPIPSAASERQALFIKRDVIENGKRVARQTSADQMVQNILQWLQGVYTDNSRRIRQGSLREYLPPINTQKPRPFQTPEDNIGDGDNNIHVGYPAAGSITPRPPFTDGFPTIHNEITPPVSVPDFTGHPQTVKPQPSYPSPTTGYTATVPTKPNPFTEISTEQKETSGYSYGPSTINYPTTIYSTESRPSVTTGFPIGGYPSPSSVYPTVNYPHPTTGYPATNFPSSSTGYPTTSFATHPTRFPNIDYTDRYTQTEYPTTGAPHVITEEHFTMPQFHYSTSSPRPFTSSYPTHSPTYTQSQSPTDSPITGYSYTSPSSPKPEDNTIPTASPHYIPTTDHYPSDTVHTTSIALPDDEDLKHPPHIHALDVQCSKEMMTINIEFNRQFDGIIYSKGFYHNPKCIYVKENSNKIKYSFVVSLNSCGTEFINAFDTEGKSYLENVLVLQNEPGIQEVWDTVRAVRCLWEGNLKKVLNVELSVDMLNQEIVTFSGDTAMARLDIQRGKGPFAPTATGLIKIGEVMTLAIAVTGDPGFDIQVKSCRAKDTSGKNVVALTDDQGCILKPKIFGAFQKTRNTGNTGASIIAYAFFNAFKFPDVMDLLIECNVDLCKTDCEVCPKPNQQIEPSRRRRDLRVQNETRDDSLKIGKMLRVVLAEDLNDIDSKAAITLTSRDNVCISSQGFVLSSSLFVSLLTSSCLFSAYIWVKYQRLKVK